MFQGLFYASMQELFMLYTIELITLFYLLRKYRKSIFHILIILLFYQAVFFFAGKDINNLYKIVNFGITLFVCYERNVFGSFKKGDNIITVFFGVFSLFYFYSALNNNDTFTIIFSQYSRYVIAYCLWFLVRNELQHEKYDTTVLLHLIYDVFLMQIIISIGKFIVFGGKQLEGLVGSVGHSGGSDGTVIPILGFIFIWFYKRGKLERKDWLFVIGLLFLGFLAAKRAVWFMVPVVIALFLIYVPKIRLNGRLWSVILVAPLAFYLGVRLTPTLNPENIVWGSFNYEYAFDYADKYQFGDNEKQKENRKQGRGGATQLLFEKLASDDSFTDNDWFGIGLASMYSTNYNQFDKLNLGVSSKGNATGFFQSYMTIGYIGALLTLLFNFSMIWKIKMKRIRWVIFAIIIWEYFMYVGSIFRSPAYMFLIIFFIHYSNLLVKGRSKTQFFKPKEL